MTVAYWVVTGLLALFYLYAGGIKIVQSRERLQPMMGWVDTEPMRLVRTIRLALAAAVGLVLVQVGGITLHLRRGEARLIGLNVVLLIAAAAAVWLSTVWL